MLNMSPSFRLAGRLSTRPRDQGVFVQKKRLNRQLKKSWPSEAQSDREPSSPNSLGRQHRRTVSATPVLINTYTAVPERKSSLKHRILNRLASGITAPPEQVPSFHEPTLELEFLDNSFTADSTFHHQLPNNWHSTRDMSHSQLAEVLLHVYQGETDINNATLFGIDIACSIGGRGTLPLNMAIVVDNSWYTSPAALMTSSELVTYIASILDYDEDRLSIYCSCSNTDELLISTTRINARQIRRIVDTIEPTNTRPSPTYLRRSVQRAFRDIQLTYPENWHVIALTANPHALTKMIRNDLVQLHLICPAAFPWSLQCVDANNGWCIVHKYTSLRFWEDVEPFLRAQTRCMINFARLGRRSDYLSRVSITVEPEENSIIDDIAGSSYTETLQSGDLCTLLVKARLSELGEHINALERFPRGHRTPSGQVDVERELEAMLARNLVSAFRVKLKYEHSGLLPGTVCEYNREVNFINVASSSQEGWTDKGLDNILDSEIIEGRLAFHLSTMRRSKTDSLSVFKAHFLKEGKSLTPYMTSVYEELRYQARIHERFELDKMQLPRMPQYRLTPPTTREDSRLSGEPLRTSKMANQRLLDQFPSPPASRQPSYGHDQAHQLWHALRAQKKPNILQDKKQLGNVEQQQQQQQQESLPKTLRLFKETARRNNRSIGEDTLRSLTYVQKQENVAPWL
jgi:hypothetical protein